MNEIVRDAMKTALLLCVREMATAIQKLEKAKERYKNDVDAAYGRYGKMAEFGDDIVLRKPLEAIVKAQVMGKTDALAKDTQELARGMLHITGQQVTLFDVAEQAMESMNESLKAEGIDATIHRAGDDDSDENDNTGS